MTLRRSYDVPRLDLQFRMAEDLGTLLERLEVPARICDGEGALLFATAGVDAIFAKRGVIGMQTLRSRLGGVTLCITTEGSRSDLIELTPRQHAVLRFIVEGLDNRAMAERLGISLHTVRRHVEGLLQRLRVRSRREAERLLRHFAEATGGTDPHTPQRVA